MFGFLTSSSATGLYRGRVPRLTPGNFTCCHTRDRDHDFCLSQSHYTNTDPTSRKRGDHDFCLSRSHYTDTDPTSRKRAATHETETMTSVSAGHIILTPTQPVGSGESMTSVSAGHIIQTPTQPVGSGRPHTRQRP